MRTVTIACFIAVAFAALVTSAPSEDVKAHKLQNLRTMDIPRLKASLALALQKADPELRFLFDIEKICAEFERFYGCIKVKLEALIDNFLKNSQCGDAIEHLLNSYTTACQIVDNMCELIDQGLNLFSVFELVCLCSDFWTACTGCFDAVQACHDYLSEHLIAELEAIIAECIDCAWNFMSACGIPFVYSATTKSFSLKEATCSGKAIEGLLGLFAQHPEQWALVSKDVEQAKSVIKITDTLAFNVNTKTSQDKVSLLAKAFEVSKARALKSVTFAAMLGAGVGIDAKAFEGIQEQVRRCIA